MRQREAAALNDGEARDSSTKDLKDLHDAQGREIGHCDEIDIENTEERPEQCGHLSTGHPENADRNDNEFQHHDSADYDQPGTIQNKTSPPLPHQSPHEYRSENSETPNQNGAPTEQRESQPSPRGKNCDKREVSMETPLLSGEGSDPTLSQTKTEISVVSGEVEQNLGNVRENTKIFTGNVSNNVDGLRFRRDRTNSASKASLADSDSGIVNRKEVSGPSLIYGLVDTPPLQYLIFFAIQQACLAISSPLGTTAIVAEAVCADKDLDLKVKILSSTMIMMGISTFLMTSVGVKLPIFQGPSPQYIIPLIVMMSMEGFQCPETFWATDPETNTSVLMAVVSGNSSDYLNRITLSRTSNSSVALTAAASTSLQEDSSPSTVLVPNRDISLARIQAYSGALMLSGALHCLLGLTGLMGVIARYVGPVTIVPVMLLFGVSIHTLVVMFSETNWTVAAITAATCIILGLFLADRKTPLPVWTPGKGFRLVWTQSHQIFALLIAILVGWVVSFFMTIGGALSDDPESKEFSARTDARHQVIAQTDWFILPYPGQFGPPGFSGTALISFLIATIISILDSIGDYYATARAARAPPPPSYALNRGVAVEGAMSALSGILGCGHATVSYSENIGAIGLSRVASRSVFLVIGALYIVLAVLGKVAAVFVSIPDAVIGGSQIITFGMLIGVILSYLQVVDLKTPRNVSIIGITVMLGMMLPHWVNKAPTGTINTGYPELDNVIIVCLSNPPFIGGIFAFVLDNLVPGTLEERGIEILDEVTGAEYVSSKGYISADHYREDWRDDGDVDVNKTAPVIAPGDDVKVLVDGKDDEFDVSADVYRINCIPNCMRRGLFAKVFPIFDSRIDI